MKIVLVDDEELALGHLKHMLEEAEPECDVYAFTDPDQALDFLAGTLGVEIAFLDVEMQELNGLELARRIKSVQPNIRIIFVTGFSEYAVDAFSLHANGYLLKPASIERIKAELEHLRTSMARQPKNRISVHTFGNFEVFYQGVPLKFERSKTKELFAYLVDRKGAGCTAAELCGILWEDKKYDASRQKQYQTVVSDLMRTLRQIGEEGILVKKRNFLSVDTAKIDCDYYRFLSGDAAAVNRYTGEYMANYSWAEFTTGFLYQKSRK